MFQSCLFHIHNAINRELFVANVGIVFCSWMSTTKPHIGISFVSIQRMTVATATVADGQGVGVHN